MVVQIKSGAKILKGWIGFKLKESSTMNDIYNGYASGSLDDGTCILDTYNTIKV